MNKFLIRVLISLLIITMSIIYIHSKNLELKQSEKEKILETLLMIDSNVIDKADYYKIVAINNGNNIIYYYTICSLHGKIIDEQIVSRDVNILIDSNILEVSLNYGTLARKSIFYDIISENKSEVYQNVLNKNKELIVYSEYKNLVIQNVFDKKRYYKSIQIDDDLKIIDRVNFENDSEIKVIYYDRYNKEYIKKLSILK